MADHHGAPGVGSGWLLAAKPNQDGTTAVRVKATASRVSDPPSTPPAAAVRSCRPGLKLRRLGEGCVHAAAPEKQACFRPHGNRNRHAVAERSQLSGQCGTRREPPLFHLAWRGVLPLRARYRGPVHRATRLDRVRRARPSYIHPSARPYY